MEKADFLKGGIEFYKIRILKTIWFHLVILMMKTTTNPKNFQRFLQGHWDIWVEVSSEFSAHFTSLHFTSLGSVPPYGTSCGSSCKHTTRQESGSLYSFKTELNKGCRTQPPKGFLLVNRRQNHWVFSTYNLRGLWLIQAEVRGHPQNEKI